MQSTTLSRRHAFKLAGLAGAAVALQGRSARADDKPAITPSATLPQGAGFYRTHVGEFEITVVSDGGFPLDPFPIIGANAGREAVEQVLKDAFLDPKTLMGQVNTLAVRKAGGAVTVVDTGCGKLFGPAAGFARQNLAAAGVAPGDVSTVLFTHLHPDHVGGATGDDGRPVFASARHLVHKAEYEFWTGATPDFSKSGVPEEARAGMIAGARRGITAAGDALKLLDGDASEVSPGITAVHTGGHTPGHCIVRFESNGESLVYVTDLVVQSALVFAHPEWLVGFDTDREATVAIRQKLFAKLAEERTLICGSHLPFPSLGHVKKSGNGYEYVSAPWKWA